ncbi:MAG: pentapeptide repeat-containing protein [Acidimicrobiia bacterium]|nr:pentapeptide repeat-containing protein [Acidimicrobiia bacterium]
MTTAASGSSRKGRAYWALVAVVLVAVLVISGLSIGWLVTVLNDQPDPNLSAGEQADLDLAARVALVDWVIRIGILLVLGAAALIGRRWMHTVERQAAVAEAQLVAARDQLQLTQNQLGLHQESVAKQAETAELNLRSERFARAITQATGGSAALRAVGLLALEDLAVDYEGHFAASIYEFLVALLKEKTTPDPEERHLFESVTEPGKRSLPQIPPMDADAQTAVAILTRNRQLFDRHVPALAADTKANGGTGLHLLDIDLSGGWLRGVSLAGATLTNVRLNGSVIADIDLREAVLTNSRAGDAIFDDVNFTKARFHSCTFAESTFTNTRFDRALVSATDFGASAITKSSFKRANATGTGFVGAVFTDSSFDEALLTGTSFHGALFTNIGAAVTTFTKATLSSVAFNDATFTGTGFVKAAVNDTDFTGARLTDVTFDSSNLRQTNFSGATLASVVFDDADLFDVGFEETSLTDTTLVGQSTITDTAPGAGETTTRTTIAPQQAARPQAGLAATINGSARAEPTADPVDAEAEIAPDTDNVVTTDNPEREIPVDADTRSETEADAESGSTAASEPTAPDTTAAPEPTAPDTTAPETTAPEPTAAGGPTRVPGGSGPASPGTSPAPISVVPGPEMTLRSPVADAEAEGHDGGDAEDRRPAKRERRGPVGPVLVVTADPIGDDVPDDTGRGTGPQPLNYEAPIVEQDAPEDTNVVRLEVVPNNTESNGPTDGGGPTN